MAAAPTWRARGERTDPAPPATSRPPCQVHGAGHDPACTTCRLVKREAITVAIATVNWLTGGAVSARTQRAWMRALEAHPFLAGRRSDAYRNLLAVARVIMWCGKRSPVNPAVWTSIPTRARIMAKTGLSESTAKKWVRWLREHGFLATVTDGSTPRYRSATQGGLVDDGAGNLGAEWALTIPLAPAGSPPPTDLDHTPAERAVSPGPAPLPEDKKRPPTGSLSEEREPATDSPTAYAREDRTARSDDQGATAWTWSLSATPGTKIEMLKAAQALRTRSPILRKISSKHLRSVLREYFRAGWTPNDVLHGLDHRPDGTAWTFTETPRWVPGWIRHRLTAWLIPTSDTPTAPDTASVAGSGTGGLLPSLSQQRAACRQAAAERQAAAAAEHQQRLATRVDAATGPAAAARAALAAAGPKAASALQRHKEDHRSTRLYFVKTGSSQNGPTTAHTGDQPLAGPDATGDAEIDAQRRSESLTAPLVPAWITTEPLEVFQREVLRRHELPDRSDDQTSCSDDPKPAMERAWLARMVATQKTGKHDDDR